MKQRRIYALKDYPPEVNAVTFAKCSRSPEPFDKIAAELNEDKSRKFHEKWVVGYGHSSVAEHAVISLAIENVSILATKVIEDNRLASFTEKSSRYQLFDNDCYYTPKIDEQELYLKTCDFLFEKYKEVYETLLLFFKKKYPGLTEVEIKNKALDVSRYILPVSTQTNLGMTINARALEHAIIKMLSNQLKEINEIGEEIKKADLEITPTLIKYAKPNEYLIETEKAMARFAASKLPNNADKDVILVDYDENAEEKLAIALQYRFSNLPYSQIKLNKEIIEGSLKRLGSFDIPFRELEHIYYTFDVLMDYGAFRDVQRHRMCTQTNQEFNVEKGFSIPNEIKESGLLDNFKECMSRAKQAYEKIRLKNPKEAQYIIPMAYKKRFLITMNLRELFHFIKLRSSKQGHESYRKIAQQMYLIIKEKHPLLAKHIQVDLS